MENKYFNAIEQFIEEKIKVNASTIAVTAASIETAKANKEKAEQKVAQALSDGDVDAYQKANKAIEKADDIITVHGNLLEKLKEKPILPQAEYESKVSDVLAEIEKTVTSHREKIVSLIDQIADLADEDEEIITRGNSILKKLQHDLNKDADCTTVDRNGYKQHDRYREKKYTDTDVKDLAIKIVQDSRYKKFGGARKYNVYGVPMEQVIAQHMQSVTYTPR